MKSGTKVLGGLLALLLSVSAAAEGQSASPAAYVPLRSEVEGQQLLHLFEQTDFSLALRPPASRGADTMMRAKWIQIADRLTRPHGSPIDICSSECSQVENLSTATPPVARVTSYEIRVQHRDLGSPWRTYDSVPVRVYPHDLLAPVKNWARENTLVVRDREGKLADFLRDQEVAFVVRRLGPVGRRETLELITGDDDGFRRMDADTRRRVIFFPDKVHDFPKIVARYDEQGQRVRVEMALLDRLDSPRAQMILLESFRMSLNTEGKAP